MAIEEISSKLVGIPLLSSVKGGDKGDGGKSKGSRSQNFEGWRAGILFPITAAAVVLLLNVLLTIISVTRYDVVEGLATLQRGSCSQMREASRWLHLMINILSTALLAASNYCMQCLSAPTRQDVDKAHSKRHWLDIGVPSIRNLSSISKARVFLWSLLAISSIPLHLLYNSALISTQASQEYALYVGSPSLLTGDDIDWSKPIATFKSYGYNTQGRTVGDPPLSDYRDINTWQRLSNEDCIKAYAQTYITGRADVVAISSTANASVPLQLASEITQFATTGKAESWVCSSFPSRTCDTAALKRDASDWKLNDTLYAYEDGEVKFLSAQYPVDYCLSQLVEQKCTIQLSVIIMVIVILCNAFKFCCMVGVLRVMKKTPLVTLGDAVESFIVDKDATTVNMCLASRKDFSNKKWDQDTKTWQPRQHFWFASASIKRWFICIVPSIIVIITAGVLFQRGASLLHMLLRSVWASDFGGLDSDMMADWTLRGKSGLLGLAVLTNIPQLLLSFLFLTYNSLFTCMLLSKEWMGYASMHTALRVTHAKGEQRSKWRLQLPYHYGIPLMVLSALLHWLISLSLFLARVAMFDRKGQEDTGESVNTVGYSVKPIIVTVIIGSAALLFGVGTGLRRYNSGMPLAGSCSAAISAACHVTNNEDGSTTVEKAVRWGAVERKSEEDVGHCSFTARQAEAPVKGQLYAGT